MYVGGLCSDWPWEPSVGAPKSIFLYDSHPETVAVGEAISHNLHQHGG